MSWEAEKAALLPAIPEDPQPPAFPEGIVEVNGVMWTDYKLTHDIFERLTAKHGAGLMPPQCHGVGMKECGQTTCYMVVQDWRRQVKKGLGLLLWPTTQARGYELDGLCFIPIGTCHKCSAASAGWRCGRHDQNKAKTLQYALQGPLTEGEKSEYQTVFERAYRKGMEARQEAVIQSSKSRYQERRK